MGEVELLRTRTCQHPPACDEDDTPAPHRESPNRGIWQGHMEDDDDDGRNWGRCSFTMAESSEGGRRWRFLWRERPDRDRGGGGEWRCRRACDHVETRNLPRAAATASPEVRRQGLKPPCPGDLAAAFPGVRRRGRRLPLGRRRRQR